MVATIARKGEVPDFVCGIKGSANQIAANPDMPSPRQNDISEGHVGSSLKTLESTSFNEIIAKLTETERRLIIAEAWSGDDRKPYIGETGCIAVAVLKAKVHHPADNQRRQTLVAKQSGCYSLSEDVENIQDIGIGHQGQIKQVFNLATSELGPNSIIFSLHLTSARIRRPICANAAEEFKAYLDGTIAPIQGRVERRT